MSGQASLPVRRTVTASRMLLLAHALLMLAAVAAAFATRGTAHWDLPKIGVLLVYTVASGMTYTETGSSRLQISGSFMGLVLAAVLLGGAPAGLIGAIAIPVTWVRSREAPHYLLNNLVDYTWFPLIAGIVFHAVTASLGIRTAAPAYYLAVFGAFVLALTVNFLGIAGYGCLLERTSLVEKIRKALLPLLPAELFSALLTMIAAWASMQAGTVGIALLGVMLLVFQYLIGELLRSRERGEELQRLATTDDLTELANRARFSDRLKDEIAAAQQDGRQFPVMLLDLDRFKEINDTLGHHYGDELLRELGPRLVRYVGPSGLVARLGGDEFALLTGLPVDDLGALESAASEIARTIEQPVVIDGMSLEVGASIGISCFPRDGEDPHTLLRRADVAMYAAKESHTDAKLYQPALDKHSIGRLSLLAEFRHALETDQILVHYQPIVDQRTSGARAAEALVRWEHPERGLLPPIAFIELVEQSGLMRPLTLYVLERAIAQCAEWRAGGHELAVAVNLSVRDLLDRQLPRELARLLAMYRLPGQALQLEITESMLMTDVERALTVIAGISEQGVRFCVDDFGTGYSSLENLRKLPISELKIDRSFVSPMLQDNSDLVIVRSTINLGHDLGMQVVAEGVEDEATLDRLRLLGCDRAQGYHISRPIPPQQFTTWLGSVAEVSKDPRLHSSPPIVRRRGHAPLASTTVR